MSEVTDGEGDRPAIPLLAPRDGVPDVVATAEGVAKAAAALASGNGPLAVDAERASGFRYSARAYLIQLRRNGSGTVLLDPIPTRSDLGPLSAAINPLEWILHSADQDLPGLAELELVPDQLYDTELAGRLAGFDRVGLAAIVERTLGFELRKGHGAADWSKRPLPDSWLNYAALDVEVLVELRREMATELERQGKTEWAAQEFEHIRLAGPPKPRPDRWRRLSHVTTLKTARQLAVARSLWQAREDLARKRDVSPNRVLPDSAIIAASRELPVSIEDLRALPVFGGPRQRRHSRHWLQAIEAARALPEDELPSKRPVTTGPPPANKWARVDPDAADRLTAARSVLAELSEQVSVPVENLVTPELVRRLCWDWSPADSQRVGSIVEETLRAGGARPWQLELSVPILSAALRVE